MGAVEQRLLADGVRATAAALATAITAARNAGLTVEFQLKEVDMSTLDGASVLVVAEVEVLRVTTEQVGGQ